MTTLAEGGERVEIEHINHYNHYCRIKAPHHFFRKLHSLRLMFKPTTKENQLSQLRDVLQSPVVLLDLDDQSSTTHAVQQILKSFTCCSVIVATSTSSQTIKNIRTLYRSMTALKIIKRQFSYDYPQSTTNLIAIYPSIEYPACVYELHTNAGRYISDKVLPYEHSIFKWVIKNLIETLTSVPPAVGGIGLMIHRN
tara:strand:- start:3420 stop:4007 length:588 start_codon:yes stop_codon:yes gene_type:complete